jgi:DNA-binding CsgD family transcriptional regulator/tetratricopeptide (TPR) repeat protein
VGEGGAGAGPGGWPLVGRDDELELASESIGSGRGVVLTGAPGVGKTRLARELVARGSAAGARSEWVAATQAAARIPLAAAAHLVPPNAIGRGRDAVLRAIVSALRRESERGPLLLGVDDAHLLDHSSAALVHSLATTGTATVVATVRAGEPAPDAVTSLWKDGPATLIALQSLARPEVEALVASVLDGQADGALLQMLWESSAGNALYLRELVQHGLESGALVRDRGLWRWPGSLRIGERLQGLLEMRMGSLAADDRSALELVAIGEPLPLDCIRALGIGDAADRLERRGLLVSRRGERVEVALAHPLFGELVRAQMMPARVDDVRLRLADALDPLVGEDPAEQFRAVLWRADSGDHSRPDQLRSAARRAWALWAAPVAERLARAALDSGPELEAGYLLGEAIADQARPADAVAVWESVEHLPGPDRVRAALAHAHASILHFHLSRTDEAIAVLRRAAELVSEPDARRVIDGGLALFRATGGRDPADGPPVTADSIDAEPNVAPSGVVAETIEHVTSGRFDAAVALAERALQESPTWSDEFPTVALLLRMSRVWSQLLAGYVLDAEAEAEQQYAIAVAEKLDYPRTTWGLLLGLAAVLRGHPDTALRRLTEGIALTGADDAGWRRPMHAYAAIAAALRGDATSAAEHAAGADRSNRVLDGVFGIDVRRADAWVLLARGETSAASDAAWAAAEVAAGLRQSVFEALALHDAARFGAAAAPAARLNEIAAAVDGPLIPALARHAGAVAAGDGAALDAAATELASLGLDLLAAEASAEAARAHRREGRRASALASADRARVLTGRCESARTPALSTPATPDALTRREREVAELAAARLSSRQIADRLGITTRTVDNLLGRVYVKLDVSGRRELVESLGTRPIRE